MEDNATTILNKTLLALVQRRQHASTCLRFQKKIYKSTARIITNRAAVRMYRWLIGSCAYGSTRDPFSGAHTDDMPHRVDNRRNSLLLYTTPYFPAVGPFPNPSIT
jgi:hypothetical protein